MNLKEFRTAYPQYDDMDDYTLTSKLHKKYYSDMDFGEFAKRIESGPFEPGASMAHEQTRLDQIGGEPQGFVERNLAQLGQMVQPVVDPLISPVQEFAQQPPQAFPGVRAQMPPDMTLQAAHGPEQQSMLRPDGTPKGPGYFGPINLPGGNVATEYSIGVNLDGRETQIPTLVPTLTQEELDLLVNDIIPNNKPVPETIVNRAVEHARQRMVEGKSPFKEAELQPAHHTLPAIQRPEGLPELVGEAQEIQAEEGPGPLTMGDVGEMAMYPPALATAGVKGLMAPILGPLETLGMPTEDVLNTALEYYRSRMGKPEVTIPDFTVGLDPEGYKPEEGLKTLFKAERLPDAPLRDIATGTAEASGFVGGPVRVAGKAGGLLTEKFLQSARPFFRHIARGMATGALLGEGKKDETLANMALFGVFEGAAHLAGTAPQRIVNSEAWRTATIKQRGLLVQSMDEVIAKNPNITEGKLARMYPEYFRQAEAPRMKTERPITPEPEVKPDFDVKAQAKTATELAESKAKLETLKERYKENGITTEIPKVEKAIAAIDEAITTPKKPMREAPVEAAPEPDQVTPFPGQRPALPTPKEEIKVEPKPEAKEEAPTAEPEKIEAPEEKPKELTPDELKARGKEIDAELEAAVKEEVKKEPKDIDVGEGEPPLEPKEQKTWLLEEIDDAIEKAPASIKEDLHPDNKITFHVPGDGEFTIFNDKASLEEFKKRAKKFPAGPLRRKKLKSLQQMSVKAQRDLYESYAGKKVTQQVEVDGETITIEKDASIRLKEIDEDLSAHKRLLDCIKALKK